jgi:hypothetical protein
VSDALRYRLIDEPRPGPLQRIALPPFLVFMVATFFMPWGLLLIALNAVALNGPSRNREIAFAVIAVLVYFVALVALNAVVIGDLLPARAARYLFVVAIGAALVFAAPPATCSWWRSARPWSSRPAPM